MVTLLLGTIVISAASGVVEIDLLKVIHSILDKVTKLSPSDSIDPLTSTIIVDVRLPRIIGAIMVGAGLALSGTVFQGILLNPLADPYTLGISSGAAFGASIAIILNLDVGGYSIPLFAFIGAITTLLAVIFLSSTNQKGTNPFSSTQLILSGIIVSAILSAGISFCKYLADEQVSAIIFWLMGSFAAITWEDVKIISIAVFLGGSVVLFFSKDLNILSLGDKEAMSLGISTKRTTAILLITASLITATCVSVSGIIGFVGLLIPHIIRFIIGPDNRKLLPLSFISGALLLLWADTFTRVVLPNEVPIGIITALIGGPVFCVIFRRLQTGKGE